MEDVALPKPGVGVTVLQVEALPLALILVEHLSQDSKKVRATVQGAANRRGAGAGGGATERNKSGFQCISSIQNTIKQVQGSKAGPIRKWEIRPKTPNSTKEARYFFKIHQNSLTVRPRP